MWLGWVSTVSVGALLGDAVTTLPGSDLAPALVLAVVGARRGWPLAVCVLAGLGCYAVLWGPVTWRA